MAPDGGNPKLRRSEHERERQERAERMRTSIRAHLERCQLSQQQACDLAGLEGASALGNFLSGHSLSLNLHTVEPLAHALNMTVSQFIGEAEGAAGPQAPAAECSEPLRVIIDIPLPAVERLIRLLDL